MTLYRLVFGDVDWWWYLYFFFSDSHLLWKRYLYFVSDGRSVLECGRDGIRSQTRRQVCSRVRSTAPRWPVQRTSFRLCDPMFDRYDWHGYRPEDTMNTMDDYKCNNYYHCIASITIALYAYTLDNATWWWGGRHRAVLY